VYTQHLHYIHLPIPFSHFLSLFHLYQPPRQNLFHPPLLRIYKSKTMTFLFKIATQGVSLWHFHVYVYYQPSWFIFSIIIFCKEFFFLDSGSQNNITILSKPCCGQMHCYTSFVLPFLWSIDKVDLVWFLWDLAFL
jgi:hypothetical protein